MGSLQTLITSSQWQKNVEAYIKALRDPKVTPSIARGKEPLDTTKEYITRLFGETRLQAVKPLLEENLSSLTRLEWGKGRDEDAKIWFVLHPLEQKILQLLRESQDIKQRKEGQVHWLSEPELFDLCRTWGYKTEEVGLVIKLLDARQYATWNSRDQAIEQLIRSVDDLKDALTEGLKGIESEIQELQVISGFDPQRYQSRIDEIKNGLDRLTKAEDIDEYNAKLRNIEGGLHKYISTTAEQRLTELKTAKDKIQPVLTVGIPDELVREITGGQAPWGAALEGSRQRLRKRYDELIGKYKKLAQDIEKTLSEVGPVEAKAGYLVGLVQTHTDFQERMRQLYDERGAMNLHQRGLNAWVKLMQRANQVHQEAVTARASFDEAAFLDVAEAIWVRITERFNTEPLDTLAAHEIFATEVMELERKIGDWQRKRREDFISEKQRLEDTLRNIGDDRPILKTNFDPYVSPESNRESLRQEAIEHFQAILAQYEQRYQQLRNEVIYAERVQQVTGDLSAEAVNETLAKVQELKNRLAPQILGDESTFAELDRDIVTLRTTLVDMMKIVTSFITSRLPESESESGLLQTIQKSAADSPRGAELKAVILQLVKDNPNFALDQVIHDLQSLFQKNQITIRIEVRR